MKLKKSSAPYIHHEESSRTIMINVILSLLILYLMAFFYYGPRVFLLGAFSVVSALLTEWILLLFFRKKINPNDLTSIVTGLLIPLMLPASVPFHLPIIACIFGIGVAKIPFGGTGHNVFNPAAAGYAFVVASFSSEIIFRYPSQKLPLFNLTDIPLNISSNLSHSPVSILLGSTPGPMGATNILVIFACLLFLISRRTIRWQIPLTFLAVTSVFAFLFVRIPDSRFASIFFENTSGLLLFGAVFMLGDPVSTPSRLPAQVLYAGFCGVIVMIFRYIGRVEETFMFAILVMNATAWAFDHLVEKLAQRKRRERFESEPDKKTP